MNSDMSYYYLDKGVLLENTPLIKVIRNYIWDPSGVFSISSLLKTSISILITISINHDPQPLTTLSMN